MQIIFFSNSGPTIAASINHLIKNKQQASNVMSHDHQDVIFETDLNTSNLCSDPNLDSIVQKAQHSLNISYAVICLRNGQHHISSDLDSPSHQTWLNRYCFVSNQMNSIFEVTSVTADSRFQRTLDQLKETPCFLSCYSQPLKNINGEIIGSFLLVNQEEHQLDLTERELVSQYVERAEACLNLKSALKPRLDRSQEALQSDADNWLPSKSQAIMNFVSKVRNASLISLAMCSLCLWIFIHTIQNEQETRQTQMKSEAFALASQIRGNIETQLNARLHLTYGLAGFVRASAQLNEDSFQQFSAQLGKDWGSVSSLQLAPKGIVTHVWPKEKHGGAIGHNLLADPKRQKAASLAIAARTIWLAGPIDLIQGGKAIIGRYPIFKTDINGIESWWGFATILIDYDRFIKDVGLTKNFDQFSVAIRGTDSQGATGEVFYGELSQFDQALATTSVSLPKGSWQIAVTATSTHSISPLYISVGLLFTFIIIGSFYFLLRLPHKFSNAIEQATMALQKSEYRFHNAIESLSDGFVIFDKDDRLITCNQRYMELYDKSQEMIQPGVDYETFLRFGYRKGQYQLDESIDEDTFVKNRLKRYRQNTGANEENYANGQCIRVIERHVRGGGHVGLRIDITELKQKEIELKLAKEKAEEANQLKSDFLATVSHEIRTPMNVIMGLLSVLLESPQIAPKEKSLAKIAHQSSIRLLHILNEILDLSKVEAGKLSLDTHDFNVLGLIKGVTQLAEPLAIDKNITIKTHYSDIQYNWLKGDERRIHQVLFNLVNNAIKFTDKGGVIIDVSQQLVTPSSCQIIFKVTDTGIGFDASDKQKLFQPFSQLEHSASRRYEGTGLGLTISQEFIQLMGGEVKANSEKGKGSTFTIVLPLEIANKQPITPIQSKEPANQLAQTKDIKILIAEDSPSNQVVFEAMLSNYPYQIDMVSNGKEAVDKATEQYYDLILMDIYMPEMNGIEATEIIRKHPCLNKLPIIALTANAMKGDRERFIQAGMDDYLAKPVDKINLVNKINYWIGKETNSQLTG
jgi:signal transduction histidine kinase/sensor domain CHASE-containing protein/CheY-like chemotaxis protein